VLTAVAGAVTFVFVSVTFVFVSVTLERSATFAAIVAIAVTFVFRALTLAFDWRTSSVGRFTDPGL
jgi:hypothetical protein